jgi:hypothetical protein
MPVFSLRIPSFATTTIPPPQLLQLTSPSSNSNTIAMDNMNDALPLLPPIGLNVDVNTAIALAVAKNDVAKSSGRKSGAPHRRTCSVAGESSFDSFVLSFFAW